MRLPWPFRRRPSDGAAAPAAAGVVQRAPAPVRYDWITAGTLLPTFASDPGIRMQRFPDEIAGSQLPAPILAPLGHARTADGPAGLVSGLARPTLAPTTSGPDGRADLPLRARHERVAQRSAHGFGAVVDESMSMPAAVAQVEASPPGAEAARPIQTPEALPAVDPRRAAVVTATVPRAGSLTVARTPDLALASARTQVAPREPGVQRAMSSASGSGPSVVPGAAAGAPTRTVLRMPGGSRVRLGPPVERSTLGDGSPSLDLALPSRGTSAFPPVVATHPAADATHDHLAAIDAPLAGGLAMTIEDEPLGGPHRPAEPSPGIPGGLVLARVVASPRPDLAGEVMPEQAPVSGLGGVAPLVGLEAIGPTAPLRPTLPGATAAGPPGDGGHDVRPRSPGRPRVQRLTARGDVAGRAPSRLAAAGAVPAGMPIPRAVAATPAGWSDPPAGVTRRAASVASGAPVASLVQGVDGTPGDRRLGRSTAALVASANDIRMPGTHSPTRSGGSTLAIAARQATSVVAQRAPSDALPAAPDDTTASEGPGTGTPASPEASVTTTAQPSNPGGTATIPDRDLDEMVRRLYPRLRRSLSSELLVARERAGTLADLR